MARKNTKVEIVTFKVDESLVEAMKGVPNRSQFIRHAILMALDSVCPVCKGTGSQTPNQRKHWLAFAADHTLEECKECQEVRLVCHRASGSGEPARRDPQVHER